MKNERILLIANWLIMGYFIVLLMERLQSLIRTLKDKNMNCMDTGFHRYVYGLTIFSVVGFLVVFIGFNMPFLKSLFSADETVHASVNMLRLSIAIGVILLSGMVHTEYTIPPIQFGAYGLLIAGMVLYTVKYQAVADHRVLLWLSLGYLIALSMAIPVVYPAKTNGATLFYIVESVVSVLLVIVFSVLAYLVFAGKAENLFYVLPIALAIVGDILVLLLRWKEEKNLFVLIFLILSVILWVAGKIVSVVVRQY